MRQFADWLAGTSASQFIQENLWVVPTIQTVHILAVAMVMGSVLMLELRILGVAARSQTLGQTARRYTPWIWAALSVLLATGGVMIVGEPVRELMNVVFWSKMGLVVLAALATLAFQRVVLRAATDADPSPGARRGLSFAALLTLLVWFAIIILGRWIAYAQTEY